MKDDESGVERMARDRIAVVIIMDTRCTFLSVEPAISNSISISVSATTFV